MIRPIAQLGDPVLRTPSARVPDGAFDQPALRELLRDMRETLADSGGVGLAGPQVGESVRVILAGSFPSATAPDRPNVPIAAFINPEIATRSDETEYTWEGCLSFLHLRVRVRRATRIEVHYLDELGQPRQLLAEGFLARVLQHEIDHLDGILTLDRAEEPDDVVENL